MRPAGATVANLAGEITGSTTEFTISVIALVATIVVVVYAVRTARANREWLTRDRDEDEL